jgi:hypothetical protein
MNEYNWNQFLKLSEGDWIEKHLRHAKIGGEFPNDVTFPEPSLQVGMVGSANHQAMEEATSYYRFVINQDVVRKSLFLDGTEGLLDFGTGWGRYLRIFHKNFDLSRSLGIDIDSDFISVARECFPAGKFMTVKYDQSLREFTQKFSLVNAYSVFSHLSEGMARHWFNQIHGVMNTGGIFCFTTQKRSFISQCEKLRNTPELRTHPWHENLARSFDPRAEWESKYDAGAYIFSPTGGGGVRDALIYGETCLSEAFIRREFSNMFSLEIFEDSQDFQQAIVVLKAI